MISAVGAGLLLLLATSLPVAVALFVLAWGVDLAAPFPLIRGLGQVVWSASDSSLLIAIPFFVLLGELLVRSGVAARTYAALDAWLSWAPGGLVHANIGTATLFSATSGSSVATAATVATIAMPQAERLGYDPRLFAGSIAAGGTLGIMIPPSINLIVYGFLTETSVPRLFLAGLVPGLLLALGFLLVTAALCAWRPALGVAMAMAIAARRRALTWAALRDALLGTVRVTGMILFVILGATVLNYAMASAGLGAALGAFLDGLGLSPLGTLLVIVGLYLVLGLFIETLSLMVATIPIVVPVVAGLGYDLVWFGILLILLVEMALITPPVGLNLYVVQSARARGSFSDVAVGAIPYVLVMLVMAGLLIALPGLALWLPG